MVSESFAAAKRVDAKTPARCAYTAGTLLWAMTAGFFLHCRSRNQMDRRRGEGAWAENLFALSGQPAGRNGEVEAPCSETVKRLLKKLPPKVLDDALAAFVRWMIREKCFDDGRLLGFLYVVLDATEEERKRSGTLSTKEKKRFVLEAKIVTPWGWNIPVMSEPVDSWESEREKQDCEINAFRRLAPRLKAAFPQLPICIGGDALYACSTVMALCRRYGWEFLLTYKEGRTPTQWEEAVRARDVFGHRTRKREPDKTTIVVRWASDDEIAAERGENPGYGVVWVHEVWTAEKQAARPKERPYSGAFATSLPLGRPENAAARAFLLAEWGRRRWTIENGFHTLKAPEGFGLEHTFCNDDTASRNVHLLMNLGHALWQLFQHGCVHRLERGVRKMTQGGWAELLREIFRDVRLALGGDGSRPAFRMRRASG